LKRSHQCEQIFTTYQGKAFGCNHGRQYSPHMGKPQAKPLINYLLTAQGAHDTLYDLNTGRVRVVHELGPGQEALS
jgi:hypothetical protein